MDQLCDEDEVTTTHRRVILIFSSVTDSFGIVKDLKVAYYDKPFKVYMQFY